MRLDQLTQGMGQELLPTSINDGGPQPQQGGGLEQQQTQAPEATLFDYGPQINIGDPTLDPYADLAHSPFLIFLKDELAKGSKERLNVEKWFKGPLIDKSFAEIQAMAYAASVQNGVGQAVESAIGGPEEQWQALMQELQGLVGNPPLPGTPPMAPVPSTEQPTPDILTSALAGIAAALTPEHAFDIAQAPHVGAARQQEKLDKAAQVHYENQLLMYKHQTEIAQIQFDAQIKVKQLQLEAEEFQMKIDERDQARIDKRARDLEIAGDKKEAQGLAALTRIEQDIRNTKNRASVPAMDAAWRKAYTDAGQDAIIPFDTYKKGVLTDVESTLLKQEFDTWFSDMETLWKTSGGFQTPEQQQVLLDNVAAFVKDINERYKLAPANIRLSTIERVKNMAKMFQGATAAQANFKTREAAIQARFEANMGFQREQFEYRQDKDASDAMTDDYRWLQEYNHKVSESAKKSAEAPADTKAAIDYATKTISAISTITAQIDGKLETLKTAKGSDKSKLQGELSTLQSQLNAAVSTDVQIAFERLQAISGNIAAQLAAQGVPPEKQKAALTEALRKAGITDALLASLEKAMMRGKTLAFGSGPIGQMAAAAVGGR